MPCQTPSTRGTAALGYERIRHDPRIEVIPHTAELNAAALHPFTDRSDKDWSLTDCLSFVVMGRRSLRAASRQIIILNRLAFTRFSRAFHLFCDHPNRQSPPGQKYFQPNKS